MAFRFGFYNAINHDRRYDALDVSRLFDGIIADGIIANYEKGFQVLKTDNNAMQVKISSGRAWFNHTWNYNDADLIMNIDPSDNVKNRKDAIVLEINSESRTNSLKVVKGTPVNGTPGYPTLTRTNVIKQYALAYITINKGVTTITANNIEDARGKTINKLLTPFSHGIMTQLNSSSIFANWEQGLNEIILDHQSEFSSTLQKEKTQFTQWFDNLHYILDGDVAGHLQNEIDELMLRNPFSIVGNTYDIEQRGNYIQIQTSTTVNNSLTRSIAALYPSATSKLYGLLSFGKEPDSVNPSGFGHQIAIVPSNPKIDEDIILYRGYHREPWSTEVAYSWGDWKPLVKRNHASTTTIYGAADDTKYGHVRVVNNLNFSASTAAVALHASLGKNLNDKITSANDKINTINNKLPNINNAYVFDGNGTLLNTILNNPSYDAFIKVNDKYSISDLPTGFETSEAMIYVVRNSFRINVIYVNFNDPRWMFTRSIANGKWYGNKPWKYIGGQPIELWKNKAGYSEHFQNQNIQLSNPKYKHFDKLLIIFRMHIDYSSTQKGNNYISLVVPYNWFDEDVVQYRASFIAGYNNLLYRPFAFNPLNGIIGFQKGMICKPVEGKNVEDNAVMIPRVIYGI